MIHGYKHRNGSYREQADRFCRVMLGDDAHDPVEKLSASCRILPGDHGLLLFQIPEVLLWSFA